MTNKNYEEFKKQLKRSLLLNNQDEKLFNKIPDNILESAFQNNFNGDLELAENILWDKYDDIKSEDIEEEIKKIKNFEKSTNLIMDYMDKKKPIIFICDIDNDGSSAQASLIEFKNVFKDNTLVTEYWQTIGTNDVRGFSLDYIEYLTKKLGFKKTDDILFVTADNGINSDEEAVLVEKNFKNAKLLITDHHKPSENVVKETKKVTIFNPQYEPTDFFKNKNISGAHTLTVLLKEIVKIKRPDRLVELENMEEIAKVSNQLDYVNTDIRHKPLKNYMISKFANLGNIMNTNNSSNQIIIGKWDIKVIDELKKETPELNDEKIKKSLLKIKSQNIFAYRLLHMIKDYNLELSVSDDIDGNFYFNNNVNALLLEKINDSKESFEKEINPNFVEQLRPYLINYESKANKNIFETNMSNSIKMIFNTIKKEEKNIMDELRKSQIMNVFKTKNSTILTPKNKKMLSIFNRKFLTKTYNEENNGFFCVLNRIKSDVYSGSMRSIYNVEEYLKELSSFEKKHGVKLSYQGHTVAAGFFIKKDKKDVTDKTIVALNEEMSKIIEKIKIKEAEKGNNHVLVNFDGVDLINKINAKLKSNLPNSKAIEPLIKLKKDSFVTDNETTKQVQVGKLVENKNYGYKPIAINFAGDAMILPVEMVKHVGKNNYEDYIQLGYMDEGAFIGKGIKSSSSIKKEDITEIFVDEDYRRDLESYYKEKFKKENDYSVDISEEMLKEIPYFKNNKYSDIEYKRFKNMVISILDESNSDILAITDTEGTGLGQAPKLINLGVMDLMIDEDGAEIYDVEYFEKNNYKNFKGIEFIIDGKDKSKLKKISLSDYENLSFKEKLKVLNDVNGNMFEYNDDIIIKEIENKKIKNNKYIINRKIKASMAALMINNADVKLTQEIITLTGIDNKFVKNVGIKANEADKLWVDRYKGKNVIFQAHNLPYDNGILKANLNETTKMLRESLVSDSALYSRKMKLAYDKIMIAKVKNVPELKTMEFYDSLYSDISFTRFLDDEDFNRIPDRTGRYVIKKEKNESDDFSFFIIDKKENKEFELEDLTIEYIKEGVVRDEMNLQSIKYSVQMLSLHEAIRNMLLSKIDLEKDIKKIEIPSEFKGKEDIMKFFMEEYHFDETLNENIENFITALILIRDEEEVNFLRDTSNKELFVKFGEDFLMENKEIVSKFQEAWIYKKILSEYEPNSYKTDKNIVSQLSYKTDLPEYKIENVLKDAYEYKKEYNLDHIVVHECHNNIIFDKDGYGDVILEGVLTVKRLVDTTYNSYTNKTIDPTLCFLNNILETKEKALNAEIGDVALDAYSRKQSQAYTRKEKTDKVKEMLRPQRLRFKLGNSILPQGSFIEIERAKKYLSKKNIKELEEKIKFVVVNQIIKGSIITDPNKTFSISEECAEVIEEMFKANEPKIKQYKKEIRDLLGGNVIFERKRDYIKNINHTITKIHENNIASNSELKKDVVLNEIDLIEIETFNEEYHKMLKKMGINSDSDTILSVNKNSLDESVIEDNGFEINDDDKIELNAMDFFLAKVQTKSIMSEKKYAKEMKKLKDLEEEDPEMLSHISARKNKVVDFIFKEYPEFMDCYLENLQKVNKKIVNKMKI